MAVLVGCLPHGTLVVHFNSKVVVRLSEPFRWWIGGTTVLPITLLMWPLMTSQRRWSFVRDWPVVVRPQVTTPPPLDSSRPISVRGLQEWPTDVLNGVDWSTDCVRPIHELPPPFDVNAFSRDNHPGDTPWFLFYGLSLAL